MTNNSRRNFLKQAGITAAGSFVIPCDLFASPADLRVLKGRLLNIFGFPLAGVSVQVIKNYTLSVDFTDISEQSVISTANTNADGSFTVSFNTTAISGGFKDIGIQFLQSSRRLMINSFNLTRTNIPFPVQEVYSTDNTKWINDLLPQNNNGQSIDFFADPSRKFLQNHFSTKDPGLITRLLGAPYKFHGDHRDPEHPGSNETLDGGGDHWSYPQILDRNRKISMPWGKTARRVIPFVVAEGQLYWTVANHSDDYDRGFNIIVTPAYRHISNRHNKNANCVEASLHGEMCIWYMGRNIGTGSHPNFTSSFTNVRRNEDLKAMFGIPTHPENPCQNYIYSDDCSLVRKESDCPTKRAWIFGSWCSDDAHSDDGDHYNEFHPVYWVVPFFGSWERFHLWQYFVLSDIVLNADYFHFPIYRPEELLPNLKNLAVQMIDVDKSKYAKYVVHLHQYGLNVDTGNEPADLILSVNNTEINNWASQQTPQLLKDIVSKKLDIMYQYLTQLGSGFLLYPGMFYCYEMFEIQKMKNRFSFSIVLTDGSKPPTNPLRQYTEYALLKTGNSDNFISLAATIKKAYHDCFDALINPLGPQIRKPTSKDIAEFYTNASMRYIAQGLFNYNDPSHSRKPEDHFNWAMGRLAAHDVQSLKNSIDVRVDAFWKDALPFNRTK